MLAAIIRRWLAFAHPDLAAYQLLVLLLLLTDSVSGLGPL
jgi:hypothetical protein